MSEHATVDEKTHRGSHKQVARVSVIVPVWNGRQYLRACFDALLAQNHAALEIIAVDNASSDSSAGFVQEHYPQVRLIRNRRNLGFAGGCNVGLRAAQGNVLVLLNQDTVVQEGWVDAIVEALQDPQVGVVGCKILEADGKTLHHCGGLLDMDAVETQHRGVGEIDRGQYDRPEDVPFVTGAAYALRRDVLERVGLFDELFYPGYYEDTDYCIRVREAGLRVRYVPAAVVVHSVSASTRQDWIRMRFYYYRNRMICALKHLAVQQFVDRFGPAERERLGALSPGELYAARVALSELLTRWPALASHVRPTLSVQGTQQVSHGLRSLLDFVIWRQGAKENPSPIVPSLGHARREKQGAMSALLPAMDDMDTVWQIRRRRRPNAPILEQLQMMAGNIWRLLTVCAYRVLFRRQTKFNRRVTRALGALAAHAWDGDSSGALLVDQYAAVSAQLADLQERLVRLEQQNAPEEADGE